MTKEERRFAMVAIATFAFLSQTIWLIEIVLKIGWHGTAWLKQDLYSPILISLFAAMAYITPFWVRYRKVDRRIILTLLVFYMINVSCYLLAHVLFSGLQSQSTPLLKVLGILIFILFAGGYYYVTNELIMPIKKRFATLFALSEVLMFVLSMVSIFIIKGFGRGGQWVDAVKMGYPAFWITLFLGLSAVFLVTKSED